MTTDAVMTDAVTTPQPAGALQARLWPWALLAAAVGAATVVFPLWIVRPFRAQSAAVLPYALAAFRWAPAITAACATFAILLFAVALLRRRQRAAVALCAAVAVLAAVLGHTNVYERMFHPAGAPRFIAASEAGLSDKDVVLTVSLHGETHAYPIRAIAYHHIVNDRLAGDPIVATY